MTMGANAVRCIQDTEPVNQVLREHEESIATWMHRVSATEMHDWPERFVREFKLDTPMPAIRIDRNRATTLGTYRPGRNGFSLKHEITINSRFLEMPVAERLLTLFRELFQQWQDLHGRSGKRNHHNREFRFKARGYGLLVGARSIAKGKGNGREFAA
jgi:hypothetical protein